MIHFQLFIVFTAVVFGLIVMSLYLFLYSKIYSAYKADILLCLGSGVLILLLNMIILYITTNISEYPPVLSQVLALLNLILRGLVIYGVARVALSVSGYSHQMMFQAVYGLLALSYIVLTLIYTSVDPASMNYSTENRTVQILQAVIFLCSFLFAFVPWNKNKTNISRAEKQNLYYIRLAMLILLPLFGVAILVPKILFVLFFLLYIGPLSILLFVMLKKISPRIQIISPDRFDTITAQYDITDRQSEVIRMVLEGHDYQYISEKLFISRATVKSHIQLIFQKTGVKNRFELTRLFQ